MKKYHPSILIGFMSFGLLLGIALVGLKEIGIGSISLFIVAASISIASFINRTIFAVIFIVIAGLLLGICRAQFYSHNSVGLEKYFGKNVVVSGIVSEDTSFSNSGKQKIQLRNIKINGTTYRAKIWASSSSNEQIKRSDMIELRGIVAQGFGSFSAAIYSADIIKITEIKHSDPAREIRDWFSDSIARVIPSPESNLGIGFLTGQHTTLPEELNNNLRLLGLTHIVVASGYNLTILVRFARRLFARFSKYLAALSSSIMIICFMMVTGLSPSMNRAGLITGLSLWAWYYGRKINPIILLIFSAAVTALYDPSYLWGDLGWCLSFAAFAGVLIMAPLLLKYFWGPKKKPNFAHQIFLETLSAQIMTAPIIALAFGQFATLALVANLLILPLVPLAMLTTFFAGVGGLISSAFAFAAWPGRMILSYMTLVIDKLATLPLAAYDVQFGVPQMITVYTLIIVILVFMWRRTKYDFGDYSVVE